MENNNMTAVEYIESCIDKYMAYHEGDHKAEPFTIIELREAVDKAKEMEKQQMENAWYAGDEDGAIHEFEQYYEDEYGKDTTNNTNL